MTQMRFTLILALTIVFSTWSLGQAEPPAAVMSTQFVPDDGIAVVTASPATLLQNPAFELFPIEIFRVQAKEQFGIDPVSISFAEVVVGLSAAGQPQFGVIMRHDGTADVDTFSRALGAYGPELRIANRGALAIEGPPGSIVCEVDPKTVYIGLGDSMEAMLDAHDGNAPLPVLLRSMPVRPGINAAIAMETIRPMVNNMAMQQADALAPDLQPLAEIPGLTESIKINLHVTETTGKIEVTLVGTDKSAAARIESILKETLVATRELGIAELNRSMATSNQSVEMAAATQHYAERIADRFIKTLSPRREDDEVTIAIDSQIGIASSGVLVGLLLPAVQSARQAARRMSASDHFKQVMLAMHNYHSAYNKLPGPSITDDDGKPLLSWRVAILPFLDELELYKAFHLDEPWDSEHNLPLSKQLPDVFATPGVRLDAGETVIQAVVGEEIGMRPQQVTRFRDFLDGLSNCIAIVETHPDSAVPWSKPSDVAIDLDDPLEKLKGTSDKGFHIGMGDGAIRFITDAIDPNLVKKLLTRNGKEVINQW